jgi:hypothetical protein
VSLSVGRHIDHRDAGLVAEAGADPQFVKAAELFDCGGLAGRRVRTESVTVTI